MKELTLTQQLRNLAAFRSGTGIWTSEDLFTIVQRTRPDVKKESISAIISRDLLNEGLVRKTNLKVKHKIGASGKISNRLMPLYCGANVRPEIVKARANQRYKFILVAKPSLVKEIEQKPAKTRIKRPVRIEPIKPPVETAFDKLQRKMKPTVDAFALVEKIAKMEWEEFTEDGVAPFTGMKGLLITQGLINEAQEIIKASEAITEEREEKRKEDPIPY